jgi:hypothetical protein
LPLQVRIDKNIERPYYSATKAQSLKSKGRKQLEDVGEDKGADDVISRSEHCKLVIEDTRAIIQARESMNQWFVSLITLILGAQTFLPITFNSTDITSALYILGVALLGFFITAIWRRGLRTHLLLLNFRYTALKHWEMEWFPPDHRFYAAEDQLYDGSVDGSSVAKDFHRVVRRNETPVDVYTVLPVWCRLIMFGIVLIRFIALIVALAPQYVSFWTK